MTPPAIQSWLAVMVDGRTDDLERLPTVDAVFHSPAVFTPQKGRAKVGGYLRAAEKMFTYANFRYVEQWFAAESAVLQFTANLDGVFIEGVDVIEWNDANEIVSFKVMIRPLKPLQTVIPMMGELLSES